MDDDGPEIDGEGVPTTSLLVRHDNEGLMKRKERKTKIHGEEIIRRNVWWEDWAEGEDLRSSHNYDMWAHSHLAPSLFD